MEYHSAMRKKQNVPFETPRMNLEDIKVAFIETNSRRVVTRGWRWGDKPSGTI